jgi:hypothetical protein
MVLLYNRYIYEEWMLLLVLLVNDDEGRELKGGRKSSFYSQPETCLLFHDLLKHSKFSRASCVISFSEFPFVKVKHVVRPQCP